MRKRTFGCADHGKAHPPSSMQLRSPAIPYSGLVGGGSESTSDGGLSLLKRRCRFSSCFFFFASAF